jgi:type IV pilus assembly protein PilC
MCRSLGTMLHSGVALLKSLDMLARKTGNAACRGRLAAVREAVSSGSDLAEAMRAQGRYFPELLIDMVLVGEQTGALPEVLEGLANHYENLVRLRRTFLATIAWPVIQLVAAILVVALMIYVLGAIGSARGGQPVDMLGLGLLGASGAITWLCLSFGSIAAVIGGYYLAAHVFRQKRFLDALLMRVPVVGGCMRAFAIARFSWAFALTQQTGMPIKRSLESSFKATGNGAFAAAAPGVVEDIMNGQELSLAFADSGLFPEDYIQMVQVGENSGTVPETLERLSPQFEDQARRSLVALAAALGWLVWLLVAGFIIFIIFRIVLNYIGLINAAAAGNL